VNLGIFTNDLYKVEIKGEIDKQTKTIDKKAREQTKKIEKVE